MQTLLRRPSERLQLLCWADLAPDSVPAGNVHEVPVQHEPEDVHADGRDDEWEFRGIADF